ncbi:MAG: hypothetical protein KKF12_09805 [Proteobacteria bacterium]|nr:hypothetical protein [Pseudomonadota bacterium]MBU4131101.1 hypothetical protein [Pseudomonadota bacterium]
MSQEFNTLELARIYEAQGYLQDAFEMYQALAEESREKDSREKVPEINAGLHRMEAALQRQGNPPANALESVESPLPGGKTAHLLEQWLMLMVLQKRVALVQSTKSQFRGHAG